MAGMGRGHRRGFAGAQLSLAVQQDHQREVLRRADQEDEVQAGEQSLRRLAAALLLAGCNNTEGYFLPQPIPLAIDRCALVSTDCDTGSYAFFSFIDIR